MTVSNSNGSGWVLVDQGSVPLSCWWAVPHGIQCNIDTNTKLKRVFIVLPEVFGVNAWVRSVADRLASQGIPALAMPLFARTAPDLDLAYEMSDLARGRRHKDATTTEQILSDVTAGLAWLGERFPQAAVDVVGFCFGGHAALLAATLPGVRCSFDFYGAGVSQMRPGGGPPSLELLPQVSGQLVCVVGTADPLISETERNSIRSALLAQDPRQERLRSIEIAGADHGFMCEARASFNPQASEQGWSLLLNG